MRDLVPVSTFIIHPLYMSYSSSQCETEELQSLSLNPRRPRQCYVM
jgi:hypothetical protein